MPFSSRWSGEAIGAQPMKPGHIGTGPPELAITDNREESGGFGGAEGDRTPDLMSAIHALSQLSYSPRSGNAA
jgi:hypothetical protein